MTELKSEGFEALYKALEELGDEQSTVLQAGMDAALFYLDGRLPPYPAGNAPPLPRIYRRNGRLSKFKTAKQQRYFFWALRTGAITVPYTRTGTLQRRITTRSEVEGDTVTGYIGTDVPYAEYVIGDDSQQAPIHKNRWWQLAKEVDKNIDGAAEAMIQKAWETLRDIFGE